MIVEILAEAERDAERAAQWYADRDPQRLRAFLADYQATVQWARALPRSGAATGRKSRAPSTLRRFSFSSFPYALIASMSEGRLLIVAVAHNRRSSYWRRRLRER